MTWEDGFVAVSAVLGESLEDSAATIGDEGVLHAADLVRGLKQRSRASRAMVLATAIAALAKTLEEGQIG